LEEEEIAPEIEIVPINPWVEIDPWSHWWMEQLWAGLEELMEEVQAEELEAAGAWACPWWRWLFAPLGSEYLT